jgi:hypothetical protein
MLQLPHGPQRLGLASPIDAILASGLALAPPDSDVEPYYPEPTSAEPFSMYPSAFLSHTTSDCDTIRSGIYCELEPYFGTIFLLNIGMAKSASESKHGIIQAYKRKILTALWRSSWVVVYLTNAAASSPWVQFELAWSLQHKPRNRIIALLPKGSCRRGCFRLFALSGVSHLVPNHGGTIG